MSWLGVSRGLTPAAFTATISGELELGAGIAVQLGEQDAANPGWLQVAIGSDADGRALVASEGWEGCRQGVFLRRVAAWNLSLYAVALPWWDVPAAEVFARPGEHVVVVSAMGLLAGLWCDGPLIHLLPNGEVSSYLAAGGPGGLVLPLPLPDGGTLPGAQYATDHDLEGSRSEHCHRCLYAQMAAALAARSGAAASRWVVQTQSWSLAAAAELVLMRQVLPQREIIVTADPPPPWRRLLQHLGIKRGSGLGPAVRVELPGLAPAPSAVHLGLLVQSINQLSAVIPPSLLQVSSAL